MLMYSNIVSCSSGRPHDLQRVAPSLSPRYLLPTAVSRKKSSPKRFFNQSNNKSRPISSQLPPPPPPPYEMAAPTRAKQHDPPRQSHGVDSDQIPQEDENNEYDDYEEIYPSASTGQQNDDNDNSMNISDVTYNASITPHKGIFSRPMNNLASNQGYSNMNTPHTHTLRPTSHRGQVYEVKRSSIDMISPSVPKNSSMPYESMNPNPNSTNKRRSSNNPVSKDINKSQSMNRSITQWPPPDMNQSLPKKMTKAQYELIYGSAPTVADEKKWVQSLRR